MAIFPVRQLGRYGIITYPPGGSYIYCNLGYQMLASIITNVSGMSYANAVEVSRAYLLALRWNPDPAEGAP